MGGRRYLEGGTLSVAERRLYWKRYICQAGCAVCGETDGTKLQAHHVIQQQRLRREAKSRGLDLDRLLWDDRVGLCLCEPCHNAHTSAMKRVPRSALRPENWEFARELGLEHWLEHDYP